MGYQEIGNKRWNDRDTWSLSLGSKSWKNDQKRANLNVLVRPSCNLIYDFAILLVLSSHWMEEETNPIGKTLTEATYAHRRSENHSYISIDCSLQKIENKNRLETLNMESESSIWWCSCRGLHPPTAGRTRGFSPKHLRVPKPSLTFNHFADRAPPTTKSWPDMTLAFVDSWSKRTQENWIME